MRSLRGRLLAYLVGAFVLSWLTVTVVTWLEARHETEELFDAQLAQAAGIVSELSLPELRAGAGHRNELDRGVYGHKYEKYVGFQVWRGEQRVFRSQSTPELPPAQPLGFADVRGAEGARWRVFGLAAADYRIYTTEDYQTRDELILAITAGTLFPLLAAVPVLALLFWLAIGRGLLPLARIAEEVASRDHGALDPLHTRDVPREIAPLTEALNSLFRRLRERFEQERRFTADAAHELRTPLAGVRTQAQVALRATDAADRDEALRQVVAGVDRSTHLVAQMLTLARLDPEAAEQAFEPVVPADLAAEVVAEMTPQARARAVGLSLAASGEGRGALVCGQPVALAVALRNLVDNALRHTPAGGQVTVSVTTAADAVELAVVDDPGIPEDEREAVLARFHRGSRSDAGGCGLGLAIVQRIAQLHAGAIHLGDGEQGRGLRAVLRLHRHRETV